MATPKGNFIAYQPLKPVEYKVGDIYNNMIDGMIKRGDAKKAAELKAAQEQRKYIGDRFDKVAVDPFATTSQLTDTAMKMYKDTFEFVADQRMKAESDPANAMQYLNMADKAQRSYLGFAKTLSDKNFVDNAIKKSSEIASGDYFLDSDETERWNLINNGQYMPSLENGEWVFRTPKNRISTDPDPAMRLTTGEVINLYTVLPPKDLTKELDKNIKDISAKFADEWTKNTDGNRTTGWKGFAKQRGKNWFDNTYGDYNANYVPTELQQFSKRTLKKQIENEADYNEAKTALLNQLASYIPQENTTDTKFTAAQLEAQRLSNQQKRDDLQPKREDQILPVESTLTNATFQIKNPQGEVVGTQDYKVKQFIFPKRKGFPQSDFIVGVANVETDKKGNTRTILGLGNYAPNGQSVFGGSTASDIIKEGLRAGYSIDETKKLIQSSNVPVTKFNPKMRIVGKNNKGIDVITPKGDVQIAPDAKLYMNKKDSNDF